MTQTKHSAINRYTCQKSKMFSFQILAEVFGEDTQDYFTLPIIINM